MIQRLRNLFVSIRSKRPTPVDAFIPLSPYGEIRQQVIYTLIAITYKRPAARGRTVMNGVVAYGQPWRTGAGHCTTVAFSDPVSLRELTIPAGRYALFTIPDLHEWTIILNKDYQQEGLSRYDAEKDVCRFRVTPQKTARFYESLTIDLDVVNNLVNVFIAWEQVQVSFPVLVTLPVNKDYEHRLAAVGKPGR